MPDGAKIRRWCRPEDDGPPRFIDRVAFTGHDRALLLEADFDDVEEPDGVIAGPVDTAEATLDKRLPAALTILAWLDPMNLQEAEDGASIIDLPSSFHAGDRVPTDWKGE